MKITKFIAFTILLFLCIQNLYSQNLFKDDFNYQVLDSLEGTGGWVRAGVNLTSNVLVKSPGLSYPGYAGSGIGNTAYLSNIGEGDNVYHSFSSQASGKLYLSFMVRVDSMTSTATTGYNICFNQSTGATLFNTALFTKKVSPTTFNFGIRKSMSTSYSNTVYNTNTTYLVVLKYSFVNGNNNDSAKMYVFSSGVPAIEPSVPNAFATDSIDAVNIGSVVLTNSYAQNGSLKSSSVKIDGIRVGLSWATSLLSGIEHVSGTIPEEYSLSRNYPNPFNPATKIGFKIPEEGNVKLQIFDITGRTVSLIADGKFSPGEYSVEFNGENLSSGTYFYKMDYNSKSHTGSKLMKMTLLK
ncbi:MAG TPA: T9SS type A sorting domain-containing protein [Ignavibacteria bacterium]|nr:T9SS type A sorting domain-containing protein [Ignavibacteria bacterium]